MIRLVEMTDEEFSDFRERSIATYAESNVLAGEWLEAEALEKSRGIHARLLLEGRLTFQHIFYSIYHEATGKSVGNVWLAVQRSPVRSVGFVYDIYVDEAFRRQGIGTQTLIELEAKARELELESLGLHVFSYNNGAIELYEKAGYLTTSMNMSKKTSASCETKMQPDHLS